MNAAAASRSPIAVRNIKFCIGKKKKEVATNKSAGRKTVSDHPKSSIASVAFTSREGGIGEAGSTTANL